MATIVLDVQDESLLTQIKKAAVKREEAMLA